ncbi:MAG: cryptochrome/photolyase family protein [Flavobacteriia bacterium]|jgi:deoxyribodipyrimidine photo-lyase
MTSLFWHRRDLRIHDNAGLYKALKLSEKVQPVFVFDTTILSKLPPNDQRIIFIYKEIERLKAEYASHGSDLIVLYGDPVVEIPKLATQQTIESVYVNRDYEPAAIARDKQVYELLGKLKIELIGAKDHVLFEKNEIMKGDGTPYTIFTPYSKKWKEAINAFYLSPYPTEKYLSKLQPAAVTPLISLNKMGFSGQQQVEFPDRLFPRKVISTYDQTRDIPSIKGTSRLSIHLRFGTISIRELAKHAIKANPIYLNELIWRDFYQMIIFHFPHSAINAFKKQYDRIEWEKDEEHFQSWCDGKTGYPMVDAGMRELNETGFMHNRVRMVVASFLTKHLLIDWRLGEAYFAEKLLDYELASNVGGWQWAAGCGCDAAPYFRVFNPTNQQEKFDKDFKYIRRWVPEFGTSDYPAPIVDHKFARERVIERYKRALNN